MIKIHLLLLILIFSVGIYYSSAQNVTKINDSDTAKKHSAFEMLKHKPQHEPKMTFEEFKEMAGDNLVLSKELSNDTFDVYFFYYMGESNEPHILKRPKDEDIIILIPPKDKK